ncbi:MAG: hypothetical protein K2X11_08005 [Acetobacteraceae bacterium]|nr:hypothetical protein [Acetobacteraceae bacterium]
MFRKTVLLAAIALSATLGVARAEGNDARDNTAETLRPAASAPANTMEAGRGARIEVIAGMERPVVVYDQAQPQAQNFAAPGTLRVTPTDGGSFSTEHRN